MTKALSAAATVRRLQQENQDHEWYPTTKLMLDAIRASIISTHKSPYHDDVPSVSVLDCGAGDGRALMALAGKHGEKYSIEKSPILAGQQDREIIPVGTDFQQSTLIDKQVDVIFSNPPYKQFEAWAVRIIREANAKDIYLVYSQHRALGGFPPVVQRTSYDRHHDPVSVFQSLLCSIHQQGSSTDPNKTIYCVLPIAGLLCRI